MISYKERMKSFDVSEFAKLVGANIKKIRHEKYLTQAYVAEHIDISTQFLSHIERGLSFPSLPTLYRICDILDCSMDTICGKSDKSSKKRMRQKNPMYMIIGNNISSKRKELKLPREEFAELLDISPYYLGEIERGEKMPKFPLLVEICHHLNLSLDEIYK